MKVFFDDFYIEFVPDYNYIDNSKEDNFLVLIKHKSKDSTKVNTGIQIKATKEDNELW